MNAIIPPVMSLPVAPELERALMAGIVASPEMWRPLIELVAPTDLQHPHLCALFELIAEMHTAREPVDLITLSMRIVNQSEHMTVADLCVLCTDSPTTTSLPYYAKQVRGLAAARELYVGANKVMAALGNDPIGNLPAALVAVTETVDAAGKRLHRGDQLAAIHITDYLPTLFDEMEGRATNPDRRVFTGFNGLDALLEGSQAGHLVLIAARPAMGKSALALNMADNAARKGVPAMFVSLEMTRMEVATRLLTSRCTIPLSALRQRHLTELQWGELEATQQMIGDLPLFIEDRPSLTLPELITEVRRLVDTSGVRLVIIDYLQLLRMGGRQSDRYQEVSEISRALKVAAMELGIVIFALCQLNRGLESRKDKRPILSDLRESGSLEQDADVVVMLYRGHVYNEQEPENHAEVIVRKNRHGRTGSADLTWIGRHTMFTDREDNNGL